MLLFFLYRIIIILGLAGVILANYIHTTKQGKKKLICPLRSNCEKVVTSQYSYINGVPVELLGMYYYAFISVAYALTIALYWPSFVFTILFYISASAVVFSVYLISLQAFVIKEWCSWCLLSGAISLIIFILSYLTTFVF